MSRAASTTRKTSATAGAQGVSPLLLANCSHLSHLRTTDLVRLSGAATCRIRFDGEQIFAQGDPAASVLLLLDGGVRLERSDSSDSSARGSRYLVEAPYATFGDIGLLGEEKRRYTATAVADSVVVELPMPVVVDALARNSPQAVAWRGAIMARLHRKEPDQAGSFGWRILERLSDLFDAA